MAGKISFYQTSSGRSPVVDFLEKIQKSDRARILEALQQIQDFGWDAVRVRFRHIEGKLWEVKIGSYRIFYVVIEREELLLLHAHHKQSQKLPRKELRLAQLRINEVINEKKDKKNLT